MVFSCGGDRAKSQNKVKRFNNGNMGWNSEAHLVINLPDPRILRVISRSLFFGLFILTLPCIVSVLRRENSFEFYSGSDMVDFDQLDLFFRDLAKEGLLMKGNKGLILSHGAKGLTLIRVLYSEERKLDIVLDSDFDQEGLFPDDSFDFVFDWVSVGSDFVDRVLRIGGIVAFPLSNDLSNHFQKKSNYMSVYLKRYSSIIVAMRKTPMSDQLVSVSRRLCQLSLETRKIALKGLEDVLLEPPARKSAKPNGLSTKIKYLPDLLGDSLEHYRRRIFVTYGLPKENRDMIKYFHQKYPRKNQEFEVYKIDLKPEEATTSVASRNAFSDWLINNVKKEEYVVIKAEAEVIEVLIEMRTISLVDELFLECHNQWWEDGSQKKSKRAYWECLSLYGRLRDEGVAVHQWWG